jgi:hypothetical protein
MRFLKTLIGSLIGKLLAGLILASLAVIGFGSDYWVHALIGWAADPLNLTLNVARLIFVLVGIVLIAILLLPLIKSRFWPEPVWHVRNIILAAGLTPQTTSPVLLIADAKSANERMRILVEYSSFHRSLGWAGWLKPRQVLLSSQQEIIKGQQIRIPVVTAKLDGSEIWWGGENDSAGNLIQKSTKYRAQIRFIGSDNAEQTYRFCLLRTSLNEAPYIVEVFTEQDLDISK